MPSFPSTEWIESAASAIESDDMFRRTNRAFEAVILLDFGRQSYGLSVAEDEVTVHEDPTFIAWDFALRASEASWREMLTETPTPLHHDLLGAWLRGPLSIEGDLKLAIQHIRPLKRIMEVLRGNADV